MPDSARTIESALKSAYLEKIPIFERVLAHLEVAAQDFKSSTDPRRPVVHSTKSRIKSFHSFYEKAKNRDVAHDPGIAFARITDVVGLRLVCNSLQGVSDVRHWVEGLDRRGAIKIHGDPEIHTKSGGYRSVHYIVGIRADKWPGINWYDTQLDEVPVEIQIRTVLEEAWGEVEHRYGYKSDSPRETGSAVRFKELSERLHGIDLDLTSLIADERRVRLFSVYVPSYEIDPHKLRFETSTQEEETKQKLEAARAARASGEHAKSARMYRGLYSDPILAPHLESIKATADFRCEEAFAHLLLGRELDRVGRRTEAQHSLETAQGLYERALSSPGGAHCVFIPWRTAEIQALLGNYREAVRHAEEAVALFDQIEAGAPGKVSRFDRRPIHRGIVLRSLGAHYEAAWRDEGALSDFDRAEECYSESLKNLRELSETGRESGLPRARLSLDLLKTYNRIIYLNYLRYRLDHDGAERLQRAREFMDEAFREVEGEEKEQLVEFLDTCLAVRTAELDGSSTLEELVEIDTKYRGRLINRLGVSKPQLRLEEMEEVLSHLEEFHEKWKLRVLGSYRLHEGRIDLAAQDCD